MRRARGAAPAQRHGRLAHAGQLGRDEPAAQHRGRCFAYDGTSERFLRTRCWHGSFFKVSSTPSFSYLLPGALAPGRYVLDLEAIDAAGHRSTLARGSSRIVFYVR